MTSSVPFPSSDSSSLGKPGPKKFYASQSLQPFSRSAAKRTSVMALGSIQHLQHQYTKLGITGPAPLRSSGRVSAFVGNLVEEPEEMDAGEGEGRKKRPQKLKMGFAGRLAAQEEELPPSPAKPEVDHRMPWEREEQGGRSVKGERELRRDVLVCLEDVCEKWGLITQLSHPRRPSCRTSYSEADPLPSSPEATNRPFSPLSEEAPSLVLDLLQTTTAAIRSFQRYVVSLPPNLLAPPPPTSSNRPRSSLGLSSSPRPYSSLPPSRPFSTSTLPSSLSPSPSSSPSSTSSVDPDPLLTLRQSTLLVLGALADLESRFRLPLRSPLASQEPEGSDASGVPGLTSSSDDTPTSGGELGEGYEYRVVGLEKMGKEGEVVSAWVEVVDRILSKGRKRGMKEGSGREESVEREGVPRVVEPVEEDEEEGELPAWTIEEGGDLERVHAVLAAHLGGSMLGRLADPSSRNDFLASLSDGTLLCIAYNAVLRASARPFAFIPTSSIHEIIDGDKSKEKVGATFRRVENLRLWAAALKLRYLIALDDPKNGKKFEARVIARREEGWEEMLQEGVGRWGEAVRRERREEGGS